ncbi:MAG: hypothetical protein RL748_81, partial [Pseudomonadota bacterium]
MCRDRAKDWHDHVAATGNECERHRASCCENKPRRSHLTAHLLCLACRMLWSRLLPTFTHLAAAIMITPTTIRLLAQDNNQRGDLFTRLIKDLFFALGYDDLQENEHKTGRELDIQGQHRQEPRRMVAECKAHQKKMGGRELNTFLGALTRERSKGGEVTGYFVSLGGFTGSGRQQEQESDRNRVILLDAMQVINELVRSKVVIDLPAAYEKAGACRQFCQQEQVGPDTAPACDGAELLGTRRGYVWVIYYAHNKQRSHFAMIHADGTPLAQAVADSLLAGPAIDDDVAWAQEVKALQYLAPPAY